MSVEQLTIATGPHILQPITIVFLPFNDGAQIFGAVVHDGGVVDAAAFHTRVFCAAGTVAERALRAGSGGGVERAALASCAELGGEG